jgi:exopolysaccharide production protein ExoZ
MATAGKLTFLPRLESLRGIAAVAVVGYHVLGLFIDTSVTGMAPVVLFFVLSGFVLARSLANDSNPVDFLWHRVFRLFPAAAAVVLLLTFLYFQFGFSVGYKAQFDTLNVILNALMIHHDINGVMWSMTVECVATPLILASVSAFNRWGVHPLTVLIAVLFGLSFIGPYVHFLGGFTNLAPLYAFVVGVLLHVRGKLVAEKLTPSTGWLLALAAIALFCFCGSRKQTAPIIALECASSALLVVLVAFRPAIGIFRILDLSIVRFFGRISYSFYLLHPIGITLAARSIEVGGSFDLITIVETTVLAIAITTPIAWLSWYCVERPFIALGKRFDRDQRRGPVDVAAAELIPLVVPNRRR